MFSKEYNAVRVKTEAFLDQRGDQNGLRKLVKRFQSKNYVENYIQSYFHILNKIEATGDLKILTGSDGRYFSPECMLKLIQMCAANPRIKQVLVAQNGILATPAASSYIVRHKIESGVVFTAVAHPGGPTAEFGIKFENRYGAPFARNLTDQIYHTSRKITEYHSCPDIQLNTKFPEICEYKFKIKNLDGSNRYFYVSVIDSVEDYCSAMKEIFEFKVIRNLIRSGARIVVNCMNGASGPYVRRLLIQELGLPDFELVKYEPMDDFGGLYPEPIPINVDDMFGLLRKGVHEIGIAIGGDGQHFLILGKQGFYVQPSDAFAVIAANLPSIAAFKENRLKGFARTFTTSRAIDRVAKDLDKPLYEVPTNWIHSSNLIQSGEVSLAGEENYCIGSEHCRERDGMMAMLAWLNILEVRRTIVNRLLRYHWNRYGRNFFGRYQFDHVDLNSCRLYMDSLEKRIDDPSFIGKVFSLQTQQKGRLRNSETVTLVTDVQSFNSGRRTERSESTGNIPNMAFKPTPSARFEVSEVDVYAYKDPVDGSVAGKEGIMIGFTDGSRIVYRLGIMDNSEKPVFCMYLEKYVHDQNLFDEETHIMLKPLYEVATNLIQVKAFATHLNPKMFP